MKRFSREQTCGAASKVESGVLVRRFCENRGPRLEPNSWNGFPGGAAGWMGYGGKAALHAALQKLRQFRERWLVLVVSLRRWFDFFGNGGAMRWLRGPVMERVGFCAALLAESRARLEPD